MSGLADKLNIEAFKELFDNVKNSTMSPFINKTSKFIEQAEEKGIAEFNVGLSFSDDEDVLDLENGGKADKAAGIVNRLVKYVNKVILKVKEHAKLIKFNREMTEVVKVEIDDMKKKVADVEKLKQEHEEIKVKLEKTELYCDEIQQRSMKGNLIISSPNTKGKSSLMVRREKMIGNDVRMENDAELMIRLIKEKTGVELLLSDVSACHALNKQGANATYIIRVMNRRPGSSWEVLSAGLLTGKNSATGEGFTDANVFINFQLTRRRGELAKKVREAKFSKGIIKYGTDQNGRITVRVNATSPWMEVTSIDHLAHLIANPPAPKPRAWQQQPQ